MILQLERNLRMTLKQYTLNRKTGSPKRGALSRVAEHIGVAPSTVRKWIDGEWTPSAETARRIQNMIHARLSLEPKPIPGRPRKSLTDKGKRVK